MSSVMRPEPKPPGYLGKHLIATPAYLNRAISNRVGYQTGATATTSSKVSSPAKSAGFRVYRGSSAATAVAAIRRSTARRPRALRPALTIAA